MNVSEKQFSLVPHGLVYLFFYSTLGIMVTFFPPHLKALGLSGTQMGIAMSIPPVAVIFSPRLFGYWADRLQRPLLILRFNLLMSAVVAYAFFAMDGFPSVILVLFFFALFRAPVPALTDAACLSIIAKQGGDYGRVRLWGSIGFVISTMSAGLIMERHSDHVSISIYALAGFLLLALLAAFFISVRPPPKKAKRWSDILILLNKPRLRYLFLASAFHWASTSTYHGFFSIHVQDLGLSTSVAGTGFAVAGIAEIITMGGARRWIDRFSPGKILVFCLGITALRWALTAWSLEPTFLIIIQLLHSFTFAAFYMASIKILLEEVPDSLRATGQGLFFSAVFGIGGGLGILFSGVVYDIGGGVHAFLFGAALSLIASLVAMRL
jgi:PPP family 3-phenylpropionic acid transporter